MAAVVRERVTAGIEGEFCVFLIGMRVNKLWKLHRWLPVARAMRAMLAELERLPDAGLLGVETWSGNPSVMVQYWRSFDHLEAYATARDRAHLPAWAEFNRRVGSNGDVGIWHETYRVRPGDFECVYNNMPPFGLANASKLVPATGRRESAPGRMSLS
jgi:Monooxygenase af470-like